MARIMLVSFAGYPYTVSSLMPDNGLANLAGQLMQCGHAARILDYGTVETMDRLYPRDVHRLMVPLAESMLTRKKTRLRDLARVLWCGRRLKSHQQKVYTELASEILGQADEFDADAIGFKLWNGDGFEGTVRIAEIIRARRPRLHLFAGGPHVDWFKSEILRYTSAFEGLVMGEGEPVIGALAEYVDGRRALHEIPDMLYMEGGRIRRTNRADVADLNSMAMPCYSPDVYPSLLQSHQVRIPTIDESRGCPGRCAFCLHGRKSGTCWRLKSSQRLVGEIRSIQRDVPTHCFIYAGSNTPAALAQNNARAILEEGLDIRYACFGHFKGMGKVDADLLARSGCGAIFFGLESASRRLLTDTMHKDVPLGVARDLLKRMRLSGILSVASVIYPAPFEDEQSRKETLDFLMEVRPDSVPVQFPGLIPGTLWDRQASHFGFEFPKGRASARRKGLKYKIKLIYPPRLWAKLPYTLHGRSSKELIAQTGAFIQQLEQGGLTTGVGHDLALMAREIGMDIRTFRDRCRKAFLTGDVDDIRTLVDEINVAAGQASKGDSAPKAAKPAGAFQAPMHHAPV